MIRFKQFLFEENIIDVLHRAQVAHGKYEKQTGHYDKQWPQWYANFVLKNMELGIPSWKLASLLKDIPMEGDWYKNAAKHLANFM